MNRKSTLHGAIRASTLALLLLLFANLVLGQIQTGNFYGRVIDQNGHALSGVQVTLRGPVSMQPQVTDTQGNFRFLGLPPGTYQLDAHRDGFAPTQYPNIDIRVGRNTTLDVQLSTAVEEMIQW